jgi:hypothetical protein
MTIAAGTTNTLNDKLTKFVAGLSETERDVYRVLLCHAAGGLANPERPNEYSVRDTAFDTVVRSLREFVSADIIWRARPPFLTEETLRALQREAEESKAHAIPTERHLLGCGGPIADAFALSPHLTSFMEKLVPGLVPTGIASYIFYDRVGAGIEAHVDTEIFAVNAIIMLKHNYVTDPSHLVLYPPDKPIERVQLAIGEMIVIDAAGLVHAREDMKANEEVTILTIGFQPKDVAKRFAP